MNQVQEIDGSNLEGGGQIIRMASAFSAILLIPVHIYKIRAGRAKPGLSAQHLTGLKLVCDIASGNLKGGVSQSQEITFYPGDKLISGHFAADTKTAGSVGLIIQSVLPCALFANSPSTFLLKGGTNAEMAPPADYTVHVFRKICEKFGIHFELLIKRRGFYPMGNGEVHLSVQAMIKPLMAVEMTDMGSVTSISGKSFVAGKLPGEVAEQMANSAEHFLKERLGHKITMNIELRQETMNTAFGTGNGIVLWAETSTGCILGASCVGKKGKTASDVGIEAAMELFKAIETGACVDEHAQDQVIILMALAEGKSRVRTGPVTLHTETAISVAQIMTKVKFNIIPETKSSCVVIDCDGIGFNAEKRKLNIGSE